MNFEIVRNLYHEIHLVYADDRRVGEISFERGKWDFHYTAAWINPPASEETKFWKLVHDKIAILNVTTRLTK